MKNKVIYLTFLCLLCLNSRAQFAPAANKIGTDAIHKDSTVFLFWCDSIVIQKGPIQINDTSLAYPSIGDASSAYGKALENGTVSLGDGGIATAYFKEGIEDGEGPDFAIFENGFEIPGTETYHMELAFVEVSTDGKKYHRFPAQSLNDTLIQTGNFNGMFPEKVRNLAGKHIAAYGVPFDLEELIDSLQHQTIHYIRIIDVIGSLNDSFASRDVFGRKINDPFPTPYPSSGFDLDAIGVIHGKNSNSLNEYSVQKLRLFPNPVAQGEFIHLENNQGKEVHIKIYQANGVLMDEISSQESLLHIPINFSRGLYLMHIQTAFNNQVQQFVVW